MLKEIKHGLNILQRGRFVSSGLPWLRQHGLPLPMSLPAYAFDRYKRARLEAMPCRDLGGLHPSCQPGLVSIVLPVYNGERYLRQALDSVLGQTYPTWELIAVDDGSSDSSGAILDEYAARDDENQADQGDLESQRIRVIHQSTQKLPGALNAGFLLARGEFLTWISDDNILYPTFLRCLVDCLQRHPGWDMVFANEDVIGEDGKPLLDSPWFRGYQRPLGSSHIHLPRDISELNTFDNNTIGAAFLYRRRVLSLLDGYDSRRFSAEDYDYWMRINALLTLRHADFTDPLMAYRFHEHSLTNRASELGIRQARDALLRFDDFRRDFYLTPLIWQVDCDDTSTAKDFTTELIEQIHRAGHYMLLSKPTNLPRLWFPLINIWVTSLPDGPFPALQSLSSASLSLYVAVEGNSFKLCRGDIASDHKTQFSGHRDAATVFTTADIWARVHGLAQFEAEIADPTQPRYRLSVVICTYRRGDQLEQAVASVAKQTLSPSDFELLIVNNDPEDQSLLTRIDTLRAGLFSDCPERLRLVVCPHLGLSHARNAGLAEAQGEIIVYLDDDAVAASDWLEHIVRAFDQHPDVGVVGGHIILRKPDKLPVWWLPGSEIHWSGFTPPYPSFSFVDHWSKYPIGANWCARRKVLLEIGGFRTRYGRQGLSFKSSEEIIAAEMVRKAGYQVGVEPGARAIHHVDRSRFTLRHIRGMLLGGRQGWYQAQMDLYFPWELGLRKALYRICRAMWPPSLRALVRTPYMVVAEARMFAWYLFDLVRRFRKPIDLR